MRYYADLQDGLNSSTSAQFENDHYILNIDVIVYNMVYLFGENMFSCYSYGVTKLGQFFIPGNCGQNHKVASHAMLASVILLI